jgi:TrmH family RNA methyltransferase
VSATRTPWGGLLAAIERTATRRGRERQGCYAIEGLRLHERALRAGLRVEQALVGESFAAPRSPRVERLHAALIAGGCRLALAPDEVLARLCAGRGLGGIVGLVRMPPWRSLPDVLRGHPQPFAVLVGVDVADPGNVGGLLRTALACGAAAYVAVGRGDPFHPRAVRISMGSLFKLPVARYARADELLADLDRHGLRAIGAVARGGVAPCRLSAAGAVAVCVGSEALGLPAPVRDAMQELVSIPMPEGVDSLSVHAASAVLLYEVRKLQGRS